MLLKKLFGSGARVKLLKQFLNNPEEEFFIRELTRILDEQINSLRRELENLENIGLLKSKERNRKKYYYINSHFNLLAELTSIIRKTDDKHQNLLKKLEKLGSIDILILTGSFVDKADGYDLDLFIVGDIKNKEIESFLSENFANEIVRHGAMTREDFLYRITLRDKFVQKLFRNGENIVLKNKLKKDTEDLVKASS
ncbi:MAG TPA: hypothetical protein VIT68_00850 [Candidatus Gracilibacteria bacterium]